MSVTTQRRQDPTGPGSRAIQAQAEGSFESRAAAVAAQLRSEVAALISALPERVSGGADLDRQLGLGSTISWRLHSFSAAANPVAALEHLPGRSTIERLVKSAMRKGIAEDRATLVLEAYANFESFTEEHAGDRATLVSMVTGVGGVGGQGQETRRRDAFRTNAELWGIKAKTLLRCSINVPSDDDAVPSDIVVVKGCSAIQSLRRGVSFGITQQTAAFGDSFDDRPMLERASLTTDVTLLPEYSSQPFPELETVLDVAGKITFTNIRFQGIGRRGAVDFFTRERGEIIASVKARDHWRADTFITVPTEVFVRHLLVPKGYTDPSTVSVSTYGNAARPENGYDRRSTDALPFSESAMYLGTDLASLQTPDVPRYPEMVSQVLSVYGWADKQFDIYGCRVKYPMLHSVVSLRVEAVRRRT